MTEYPVHVTRIHLVADSTGGRGGQKEYRIYTVSNARGQTLLIKRWGKVGSLGQMKVERFGNGDDAAKAVTLELRTRNSRDYDLTKTEEDSCADEAALKKFLTIGVWTRISPEDLQFVDPNIDTKGCREHRSSKQVTDKNGNTSWEVEQKLDTKKLEELARQAEQEKGQKYIELNANWGMF